MKPIEKDLIKKIQSEFNELEKFRTISSSLILMLDNRILEYSETILNQLGQKHNVVIGKSDKRKFRSGNCYQNSVLKTLGGDYQYVEGYILNKESKNKISHAWNVDVNGNHFDFTLKNNDSYEYFGLIVPISLVYDIGKLKGNIWGSCLPYLQLEDTDKVKTTI